MTEQEDTNTSEQQLVEYISVQRNQGFTDESIRSALVLGGWNPETVDSFLTSPKSANRLPGKVILFSIVAIVLISILIIAVYLLYFNANIQNQNIKVIESTNETLVKNFCTDDTKFISTTSEINLNTITFEELVETIQQAKADNDFEQLQLIKLVLSRLTTAPDSSLSQSRLYSEALELDWRYSSTPSWYKTNRSYATKDERFKKLNDLSLLFQAMHQAGFTRNFSTGSVQLSGETRYVTQPELNYYNFYFSEFYQNLLKNQESSPEGLATVQSSATVFLAEIALVNDLLPADAEYEKLSKEWLTKVQYYIASTSKESLTEDLNSGSVASPSDRRLTLGLIGYLEARDGNIEEGIELLNCAATKYGDELAMANLGEVYGWGRQQQTVRETLSTMEEPVKSEFIKTINPIYLSETELPNDVKKSLYWSLLVEKVDPFRNGVFTYADNQLGWNNIGRIDTIVNTGLLSDEEMNEVSCQMLRALKGIYPEIPPMYEPSGCPK